MQEVCGFKVPDPAFRKWAIGSIAGEQFRVKKYLDALIKLDPFEPIPEPQPGDWLFSQDEDGQTFDSFKSSPYNQITESRKIIAIVPLEDSLSSEFLEKLKKFCELFYPPPVKVEIFKKILVTSLKGVASRQNPNSGHFQYNASHILKEMQGKVPRSVYCMMGVLNTDIYNKDEWNFVFGLASTVSRAGVFSFARYDDRFFDPNASKDNEQIEYRACRVMAHEVGHMFGLKHCVYNNCLMNGSMSAEENQRKCLETCLVCIRKLQFNIKFDFHQRYLGLFEYCKNSENRFFKKDAKIYQKLAEGTKEFYQKIEQVGPLSRAVVKPKTQIIEGEKRKEKKVSMEPKKVAAKSAVRSLIEEYKANE